MTPVEFLLARLAEDEAAASTEARGWETGSRHEGQPLAWVQHVRRWPVDRVLAEVEAKRRIVELHSHIDPPVLSCRTCGDAGSVDVEWPCETIRLLVLPYAEHPDYRQEWRP